MSISFGPLEHVSKRYLQGDMRGDELLAYDLSNLRDTPKLLQMYMAGEIQRDEALQLHSRLQGTHRPGDPEHVRLGLLNMNSGDQQLTFAQLARSPYTEKKLENLRLLCQYTTLTTLYIDHNAVGDAGARALAGNTTITKLSLYNNNIGDAGAEALAGNTTLTELAISRNDIGAAGAQALAGNTTLTTLNITWNNIGVAGARALAGNTTLTTLNITWNNIGDVGAQALAGNTTLTTLKIYFNGIGAAGAQALAANTTITNRDF